MQESKDHTRALLNEWLQSGSSNAFEELVRVFSEKYQKHGQDGLAAFKEFLKLLPATQGRSPPERPEDVAVEPPYDFTGCVSEDRETEW